MSPAQQTHRSGLFKQKNKAHKTGNHRSKGAVEKVNRGRIEKKVDFIFVKGLILKLKKNSCLSISFNFT
jgi:hypothetical protein